MLKKKVLGQFSKNYRNFLPKKLSLSSLKYRFGIQNPRSRTRKKPIPDPGVKKAPDPESAILQIGVGPDLDPHHNGKSAPKNPDRHQLS